mmetsp:Transcript_106851/g.212166  ORF Transcript_106851/g.212166 Transcript_106851/m.212166 type:complete len:201 (-) Transcript_106851:6-608(-)
MMDSVAQTGPTTESCYRVKLVLRALGALVTFLLAVEAGWLFAHPQDGDFWDWCHWLGQGSLGIIVGLSVCYIEVRRSFAMVVKRVTGLPLYRTAVALFYFWLGCYVMGGAAMKHANEKLKVAAHVTGFVSWGVSLGNLLVLCAPDVDVEEKEGLKDAAVRPSVASSTFGASVDDVALEERADSGAPAGGWSGASRPFGVA